MTSDSADATAVGRGRYTTLSIVAASLAVSAVAAGVALYAMIGALADSSCDIYCGPLGVYFGVLILGPIACLLWLAGLVVAVVPVLLSRGRSWIAWIAIGISLAVPVVIAIQVASLGWTV